MDADRTPTAGTSATPSQAEEASSAFSREQSTESEFQGEQRLIDTLLSQVSMTLLLLKLPRFMFLPD